MARKRRFRATAPSWRIGRRGLEDSVKSEGMTLSSDSGPQDGTHEEDAAQRTTPDGGVDPESSDASAMSADDDGTASAVWVRGLSEDERGRREALEQAEQAEAEGRVDDAIKAYQKVIRLAPADVTARNGLGVLLDRIGEHDQAVGHLRAAVQEAPENPEILINLGAALGAIGRFDDAEAELRTAMKLAPDNLDARANLGILYFRKGLYESADAELRSVCLRDGAHGPAHFYRGEALNRLGRYDEAIESLERAIELQPMNARAYYTLGILFDRKYLHDRAAAMFRKSREINDR
jgi:Flp pilus assembly protein TadD